jgi:cellulose synthase/poly-beta-1,6-N-acetylglucosamine synthase-like glycosyltransferase
LNETVELGSYWALQVLIAGQMLFLSVSGLTKLSVLVSYIRVTISKRFLLSIYTAIGIATVSTIGLTILLWAQCMYGDLINRVRRMLTSAAQTNIRVLANATSKQQPLFAPGRCHDGTRSLSRHY